MPRREWMLRVVRKHPQTLRAPCLPPERQSAGNQPVRPVGFVESAHGRRCQQVERVWVLVLGPVRLFPVHTHAQARSPASRQRHGPLAQLHPRHLSAPPQAVPQRVQLVPTLPPSSVW